MTPFEQLDAWRNWYEAARSSLRRIQRLAEKYWPDLPWEGTLGRDNMLGLLEDRKAAGDATFALTKLEDLAVIELFSIFEGIVRTLVAEQVRAESVRLAHPVLKAAAKTAVDAAERRSFAEVLNSYSQSGSPDLANLAEQVRQVRRYRNWLSHGRRGKELRSIEPKTAYERLRRFLELILPPSVLVVPTTGAVPDAIP